MSFHVDPRAWPEQEERILQFLEENDAPVAGLRSILEREADDPFAIPRSTRLPAP